MEGKVTLKEDFFSMIKMAESVQTTGRDKKEGVGEGGKLHPLRPTNRYNFNLWSYQCISVVRFPKAAANGPGVTLEGGHRPLLEAAQFLGVFGSCKYGTGYVEKLCTNGYKTNKKKGKKKQRKKKKF